MINAMDATEMQAITEFMEVYPRHSARPPLEALAEIYGMECATLRAIIEIKQEAENNIKKLLPCAKI